MSSFCYYRLPSEKNSWFLEGEAITYELTPPHTIGFVYAPFNRAENAILIPGRAKAVQTANSVNVSLVKCSSELISEQQYLQTTRKAITQAKEKKLQKVVTARNLLIDKPAKFEPSHFYNLLCKTYPKAFVYWFYSPQSGMWMGATPEILLHNLENSALTMALAGTRKADDPEGFGEKEVEEQQMVFSYLAQKLQQNQPAKVTPGTLGAGNLVHLVNHITFSLPDIKSRWNVLKDIHPTPAVGGFPFQESLTFLQHHETLQRRYYSGYLGPFTARRMNIYVNLRCMQIFADKLELFAGAGITSRSVAEEEWNETGEKLKTLLSLI